MAESFIQLAPDSTGKKAHTFDRTIGANTVQDEVILEGEQYLASYTVSAGASIATLDSHPLQIMAGASLKVRVRRIEIYQSVVATTAALGSLSIFRLTTAGTGGGAVTPALLDPADSASGATAMTLPTAKGTEGTRVWLGIVYWLQTVSASTPLPQPSIVIDFDQPRAKPLIIAAGTSNGIAIKNETAIAGASVRIVAWISESNF